MTYSVSVIIPAAGSGVRMGMGIPKAFIQLDKRPILAHTIEQFLSFQEVKQIIIAVPEDILKNTDAYGVLPKDSRILFVKGGAERLYSIHHALSFVQNVNLIAVHDAVRPFVPKSDIKNVFDCAFTQQAAILAIPTANTLKRIREDETISETISRDQIWQALTPQVFDASLLKQGYEKAIRENHFGTDDASLVEAAGFPVHIVKGDAQNIKITYPSDLDNARLKLERKNIMYRTGIGFDVHQLKQGRKLILGGVEVPFEKGLLGHSDADVLIHAIIDAITGALALGDIGSHFPDTDASFKNIDSRILLRKTSELLKQKGYSIENIDSTIVAQRPKLRNYIDQMRVNIAVDLEIDRENVSVKATTSEKIGFVGREEGMCATAVVLLKSE